MRHVSPWIRLVCCAAVLSAALRVAGAADVSVFTQVTVITMERTDGAPILPDRDVFVRDGRIYRIVPSGQESIPPSARRIDGRGRYLIPGLVDMHVHLREESDLFLYLAHGVTTVFNLSGAPRHLELREAIREGKLQGPQFFSTGPTMGGDPPLNPDHLAVAGASAARSAVEQAREAGYDAIKIYSGIEPAAFHAAVERAHGLGLPVFGHVPWSLRAQGALVPGGLDAVAHVEELFSGFFSPIPRYISGDHDWVPGDKDAARMPGLVGLMKAADVALVANGWVLDRIAAQAEDLPRVLAEPEVAYLSPSQQLEWGRSRYARRENHQRYVARARRMAEFSRRILKGLADADVPMMLGTDAEMPGCVPGHSALMEVAHLVDCGLTPRRALAVATTQANAFFARHLPQVRPFGVIRPGYRADLVLLRGDPLQDPRHLFDREGVMAAGRWIPRSEIDEKLGALAARERAGRN